MIPVQNPAFPNYGSVATANRLTLQEIEFLVENEAEYNARLDGDGIFDWETQTATVTPTGVPLAVTTLQSTGDITAPSHSSFRQFIAPAGAGDRETIVIHAVVRAITQDGDQLESSVPQFPIEICNGCLSNPICPVGTEQVAVLQTPCNPGQDAPLFTCEVPGAVQQQERWMFEQSLSQMLEKIPGSLGATLLGHDGLPVACYSLQQRTDQEIGDELWEAASIDLLRTVLDIQKATGRLKAGSLDQISIQLEAFTLLMKPLSNDYILVLSAENQAWAGKGRYIMRMVGDEMRQELGVSNLRDIA